MSLNLVKYRAKIVLTALGMLSSLWSFSQDTLSFGASKDTYINDVIADQYQGQTQSFIAAGWTYNGSYGQGRSLMGFDVCDLPEGFQLISATLHLFQDYSASHAGHTTNGLNSAKLHKITGYWDESTTWSSQPTYDANLFSSLPSSNSSSQDYTIDVTGIVSNALTTSNEIGFYFKLDEEITYRSLVFASSDHPDPAVHPRLEIIYSSDSAWCGNPSNPSGTVNNSENCFADITIPNVFSPNGDDVNDVFTIKHDCISSFEIHIFNRWGEAVYQSDDPAFEWNGKLEDSDREVAEGVYFYTITYSDQYSSYEKSGMVSLLR